MRVILCKFVKSHNALIVLSRVSQVLNDLFEFVLYNHFATLRLLRGCRLRPSLPRVSKLKALNNNLDPLLDMVIRAWVVFDNGIALPNGLTFKLDNLIDECLDNSDSKIIILRPVIMVNDYQVLMDRYKELRHVQLLNKLVHYLVQFQKALNDEPVHLWEGVIILELFQKAKQGSEDVSVVTVFQHPDHRGVEVFEN